MNKPATFEVDSQDYTIFSDIPDTEISTSSTQLNLMSQDIWSKGTLAEFIITPHTLAALSEVVKKAKTAGVTLNPRGAGMSYTGGYIPDREKTGIIDFSKLDRIIEINTDDMYVTVEAGCSWSALHKALKEKGFRTPFWGPLSGLTSTVGGGLSQNNAFFGAGNYGTTGDSVLCVTVVLGDGTIVRTGTAGTNRGKPFFRHYGPDLTGLFCGDAGALGFKAEITLRLIPIPDHEEWASFEFPSRASWAQAMATMMKENIACELFGFDPNLQRVRMKRASLASDVKTLGAVVKNQGSLIKGLKEGAKIALAGRSFLDDAAYSLHFVVEGKSKNGVADGLEKLSEIAQSYQGSAIENSIPKIIRSHPFTPLNNILGPTGERWVPVHGIVPTSEGDATLAEIDALFDSMRVDLDRYDILTGYLITNVGVTGYLVEPVFIWPEEIYEIHEQTVETSYLSKVKRFTPNPEATAIVKKARSAVIEIFKNHGAAHFQIGKTYPYKEERSHETWTLLAHIKNIVDEDGIINPGALGLNAVDKPQELQSEISVRNPRTGEKDYTFAPTQRRVLSTNATRMRNAQKKWAARSVEERANMLRRLGKSLNQYQEKIVEALKIDTGRHRIAQMEVLGTIASINSWVDYTQNLSPESWHTGHTNTNIHHTSQFVPLGLVGVISPWNFPLTLSMIDTIPALLAGCAVIIKPSEVTPRFVKPVQDAITDAGLQDILNFAMGDGSVGAALVEEVDAICFTGSVPTGRKVAQAAAKKLIPAFLELGGKDPLIVTKTANLAQATDAALRGSVLATGQACQSIERIYVHHSIHDEFVDLLATKAREVRLNAENIDSGDIGPIIFEQQISVLERHIEDAVSKGAKVKTGGQIDYQGGAWLQPTVLTHVDHSMLVMREETFGPILPVMSFEQDEQAIDLANDTEFGLSAAVIAGSESEAEDIAQQLDAGAVSINDAALTALFHEAEKQSFKCSGLGPSRMGASGYQRFFRRKALIVNKGAPRGINEFSEKP